MSAEVLQEYLFSIGYKIDPAQTSKFDKTLSVLNSGAFKLGAGLVAAGTAALVMTNRFASSMESMYYSSKRADSTVKSLQALEYAGGQIGLKSGQMTASLEAMSKAIRSNPGLEALLNQLGVEVKGRDKADVLMDFVKVLSTMPPYLAQQYSGMFGIDPDTLYQLVQGREEMEKMRKERKALGESSGFDADKAAEASKNYANALRQVEERLSILKGMLAIQMLPVFQGFTSGIVSSLDTMIMAFGRWDKASAAFAKVWTGMKKLSVMDATGFKDIEEGRAMMANDVFAQKEKAKEGQKPAPLDASTAARVTAPVGTEKGRYSAPVVSTRVGTEIGRRSTAPTPQPPKEEPDAIKNPAWDTGPKSPYVPGSDKAPGDDKSLPRGQRNNNPGNIEYGSFAKKFGATGTDGRFAIFPTPEAGLAAMSALLNTYGQKGRDTPNKAISAWAPPVENETNKYAASVAKALGVGVDDKIDMSDPAVRKVLMGAITRVEIGRMPYDSDMMAQASQVSAPPKPVVVNQNNTYNVTSTDPKAAVAEIRAVEAQRTNDVVRNLRGAVQ